MKPIRIFDASFNLLGELDVYTSLMFTKSWSKPGDFELYVNRHVKYADKLQKGNLVMLATNKVGIIKHREIALDRAGKVSENWVIKGPTLSGLTKQRIVVPPVGQSHDSITSDYESVFKHYVDTCIINPTNTDRNISQVINAINQNRGPVVTWDSRYQPLDTELEKLSLLSGYGWDITLDLINKKWVFDILVGLDRSVEQSINSRVIFDPDFDSLETQHYSENELNYRNFGYVGGQGDGSARTIVTVGSATGLNRIETFVDARDINVAEQLTTRGLQKLEEFKTNQLIEGQILFNNPFKYETHWNLGDIVTLSNKGWGVVIHPRVVEVKEVFEPTGHKIYAIFGSRWPTLISEIKKELDTVID